MTTLSNPVAGEHGRLRELLQVVILRAAEAVDGEHPSRVRYAAAVGELKKALHDHALREGQPALDAEHEAEDAAAIQLRVVVDLEDVLLHVGEILGELEREERALAS